MTQTIVRRLARSIKPAWLVLVLMLAYSVYFSSFSIRKHAAFQTSGYDLSFFVQALWNTLHGEMLRTTVQPGATCYFQVHFAPSLLLLAPFYALWSSPVCLLVLQSVAVASGAWPVFRLVEGKLSDAWLGAGYAGVYLLYPPLQAANLFDFHDMTLVAPLLAWAWYAAMRGRWWVWGLLAAVVIGFREEAALTLLVLGVLLIVQPVTRRAGVWTMVGAATWLGLVILVIPWGAINRSDLLPRLGWGNGLGEVVISVASHPARVVAMVTQPQKIRYLCHLFAPVGYLSFLAPAMLVPVLPTLTIYLLSAWQAVTFPTQFHYSAPFSAFVVLAAAEGSARLAGFLARRTRFSQRFLVYLLFGYVMALSLGYQTKLSYLPYSPHFRWPEVTAHHRLGEAIAQQIPPEASVSAQNPLAPHVSHRRTLYIFPFVGDAEYVFLDLTVSGTLRADGQDQAEIARCSQELLADPEYAIVVNQDGYVLLRRK
jgi:uncharacterized membrane protein